MALNRETADNAEQVAKDLRLPMQKCPSCGKWTLRRSRTLTHREWACTLCHYKRIVYIERK